MDVAFSDPVSWLDYPFTNGAILSARNITQQLRAQSWSFEDATLDECSGAWPLKLLADGSAEDVDLCEDSGFSVREAFEHAWTENVYCPSAGGV